MAFKQITKNGLLEAIDMAETKKPLTGYLLGVKILPEKVNKLGKVTKSASAIYSFLGKDDNRFDVWGCAAINQNLLADGVCENKSKLDPQFIGCLVRLTFEGTQEIEGRSQPMKLVTVEVDDADKLAAAKPKAEKTYTLGAKKRK